MDQENAVAGHEGAQLERLTFFSDAVFAIAMTLLVIEIRLPHVEGHYTNTSLAQALLDLIPNYVGFVVSFLVIGRFWVAHHRVFGMLVRSDSRLVWTNLFLLLFVAFMPFPTAVLSEMNGLTTSLVFYTGWLTGVGLIHVRLVRVALIPGKGRPIADPAIPEATRRYWLRGSFIAPATGVLAMLGTLISPWTGLAMLVVASPVVSKLLHWGQKAPE